MKDQETVNKFMELRAQGWSFVRIAAKLSIAGFWSGGNIANGETRDGAKA